MWGIVPAPRGFRNTKNFLKNYGFKDSLVKFTIFSIFFKTYTFAKLITLYFILPFFGVLLFSKTFFPNAGLTSAFIITIFISIVFVLRQYKKQQEIFVALCLNAYTTALNSGLSHDESIYIMIDDRTALNQERDIIYHYYETNKIKFMFDLTTRNELELYKMIEYMHKSFNQDLTHKDLEIILNKFLKLYVQYNTTGQTLLNDFQRNLIDYSKFN